MHYYSVNDSANPCRNYGSDAVQHLLAVNGARYATRIEGPDSIGCYLVTLDNGDSIDISQVEQLGCGIAKADLLPSSYLNNRSAIKRWLAAALADNARRAVAVDMAAIASKAGFDADAAFNAACADLEAVA